MTISLIVAVNESWQIGNSKSNDLLYKIKPDLKRFRSLTLDNFVLYGKTTYRSLPKLFDKRTNVIMTRDKNFKLPQELHDKYEIIIAHDLERILNQHKYSGKQEKDLCIIGGSQIYAEAIHWCDNIYLTMVHDSHHPDGDVYFNNSELSNFKVTGRVKHYDEQSGLYYSFIDYTRRGDK